MRKKHPDSQIIDSVGGCASVARQLGFPECSGVQRVYQWTKRGIPARIKLDNAFLRKLRDKSSGDSK